MNQFLGFDLGATKVAWGSLTSEGELLASGRFSTPASGPEIVEALARVIAKQTPVRVGIGLAGVLSADHRQPTLCTNIPQLNGLSLADQLEERCQLPVTLDNDARCALIGEVWKGAARDFSSTVLITLGTGVGGAVMQKGTVRPHPQDISKEIGRMVVDPTDLFPARSGAGSIEALIGGRNLEQRFQINLAEMAAKVRQGDPEAEEIWQEISQYFLHCIRALHQAYACKQILVGGVGSQDLQYYLQATPPCPVRPAELGEQAGIYGAARLAIDAFLEEREWN